MAVTTAKDVKKQFKTIRSDIPRALEMDCDTCTVNTLFVGKHDSDSLAAILIRYEGAMRLSDFRAANGNQVGTAYYNASARRRFRQFL